MKLKKFQMGGVVSEAAPAPAQEPVDPMAKLIEMAMAALQNQDPNLALQVCEALVMLVQQANAPAPIGAEPSEAPVFRRGGSIRRK